MSEGTIASGLGGGEDQLSAIARERRERAERETSRPRPSIIESVRRSEVLYYLKLHAIPWRQFDVQALSDQLEDMYAIRLADDLDYSPLLSSNTPAELHKMERKDLIRLLARSSKGRITWKDGRFPTRADFVGIQRIAVNFESIAVTVAGQSGVAEVVAQEVMEAVWSAAGVKKNWKTDLESMVELTGYGTSTFLQLHDPFEDILDDGMLKYLRENLTEGERYASAMGNIPNRNDNAVGYASVALSQLVIRVSTFDPVTGRSDWHDIDFDVMSKNDYGRGRIVASSSLPYEAHEKLVLGLFATKSNKA